MRGRSLSALILLAGLCAPPAPAEELGGWRTDAVRPHRPARKKKKARRDPASHAPAVPAKPAILEPREPGPVPESPQTEETRLTKNWGGARARLSGLGVDLAVIYKGEFNANLGGGLARGTAYLGNLDVRVSVDGDKLLGLKGTSAFFYGLGDHGGHPSQYVGDAQVTSNIETNAATFKLYEAWIQQLACEDRLSLLAGLHDLNSEFYVTESSGLFLNNSFGTGKDLSQSGVNGPSVFPATSPAIRVRAEPSKAAYLQAGVFGGTAGAPQEPRGTQVSLRASDGALLIVEAGYLRGAADPTERAGKYGVGAWSYTRAFDRLAGGGQDASRGAYLLASQSLGERVSVFVRYGVASSSVNRYGSALGAGIALAAPLPTRDKDRFGLAVANLGLGDEFRQSLADAGKGSLGSETALEATYRIELVPGVAIQPDFQYVFHPSADPTLEAAQVLTLRFELSF
jgi:porin